MILLPPAPAEKLQNFFGVFLQFHIGVDIAKLVLGGTKSPNRISETGEYTINLNEDLEMSSTGCVVGFEQVSVGDPEYDAELGNVIAKTDFVIQVDVPGKKYLDEYAEWLTDFTINGNPVTYSVRKLWPDSEDCYVEYWVKYNSTAADKSYKLTCKVNDQLTLQFPYNKSFFDHVDRATAVSIGQAGLDAEYGIITVDWQDDANKVNYIEGKTYAMTGKIVSFGKYMGDLTDQYYITLSAKNSLLTDAHCYFSESDWAYAPSMANGDIITVYSVDTIYQTMDDWDEPDIFVRSTSDTSPSGSAANMTGGEKPSDTAIADALAEIVPPFIATPGPGTTFDWYDESHTSGYATVYPQSTSSGVFAISGSITIVLAKLDDGSWFAENYDPQCTISYNYADEYLNNAGTQGFYVESAVGYGNGYAWTTVTPLNFADGGSDPTGDDVTCYWWYSDSDDGSVYMLSDGEQIAIYFDAQMVPVSFYLAG